MDAAEHGGRADHSREGQDLVEAGEIDAPLDAPMRQQGLDLGAEQQLAAHLGIEQGGDADMVATEQQPMPTTVVEGEGELTVQPADEVGAVFFVKMNQDFDVAAGAEAVAAPLQLLPQFTMIEDLAIADRGDLAVLAVVRLVAGRKIDDREPGEAEGHPTSGESAAVVRAAMAQPAGHGAQMAGVDRTVPVRAEESDDAAHPGRHPAWLNPHNGAAPDTGCRGRRFLQILLGGAGGE